MFGKVAYVKNTKQKPNDVSFSYQIYCLRNRANDHIICIISNIHFSGQIEGTEYIVIHSESVSDRFAIFCSFTFFSARRLVSLGKDKVFVVEA